MVTRIAVVADIHHGRDTFTKRGTAALGLLDDFIDGVNAGSFDAVIDLGDRISDETAERDVALQRQVANGFHRLGNKPRHHVIGNHDLALLSADQNAVILDAPMHTRSAIIGEHRLVFWQPDVSLTAERGLFLKDGDLDALEKVLNDDDRPTLLISHVPLSGHAQTGNYYFERNPGHATYAENAEIRSVMARAPCPLIALAGHVHWNTLTMVDGTAHLTLQSLTETFTTGEPAASTAVIEIDGDEFRWTVRGLDRVSVTLPWPKVKPQWRPVLNAFSDMKVDPTAKFASNA
ncbi:metallophosphoesterase [Bradyrhizobium sp. LHD-71]|uniref:metallophosphoesterase family protein n=1 Tax=Bradyrhizobium sp. LHD-71 TaxID=3072141 RepID=UPI00280CA01E|nr:metallophosphoesterase [Bradyrhizobium sp. LHD-71]MDQ8732110.1 metallophosphoesterase [Bradyrhizobium sp. LHD-71]